MRHPLMCVFFFLLSYFNGAGQSFPVELGIGVGGSAYQGDLSPYWIGSVHKSAFSFQTYLTYYLHPAIAIRGNYLYGSIHENEDHYGGYHPYRNFEFETTINEFSAQLIINPFTLADLSAPGQFTPYLFGGAGFALVSVQRDFSRFNHTYSFQKWVFEGLKVDSVAVMPTHTITFPAGVGLRYQIGENLALYMEGTKHFVKTDYLDGFSKAANRGKKDAFTSMAVGVVFRIGGVTGGRRGWGRYDCPTNVY